MRVRHIISTRSIGIVVGMLVAMAVGACEHPTTSTIDYRVEHKISAQERVFSLRLRVPDGDLAFEAREEDNIRRLAREYLRRGRGPFLITTADGNEIASRRIFDKVAALVVDEGVSGDQVYFQVRRGAKAESYPTKLSFSGYYIRLPECGDWSGETGFAPNNQPHSDFGCSYQRNFGLMLANPGDLVISRDDDKADAFRTDFVIGTYRSGTKALGRPKPALEQGEFADVQ